MAGKPITRASQRVARVVDKLSKNTLADIVLDRIQAEIGEDATDKQMLSHLQPWVDVIQRLRGDKPVSLLGLLSRYDKAEAEFLEREEQWAASIDKINQEKLKEPF